MHACALCDAPTMRRECALELGIHSSTAMHVRHACSMHSFHSTHATDSCCDAAAIERHAAIACHCGMVVMVLILALLSTSVPILGPGRATCCMALCLIH